MKVGVKLTELQVGVAVKLARESQGGFTVMVFFTVPAGQAPAGVIRETM